MSQSAVALEVLRRATFAFEVVVVDDGGPEPLDTLIASSALESRRTSDPAVAGGAGRRPQCRRRSRRGRCLAFIDDDCAPAPELALRLPARDRTGRSPPARRACGERADRESLFDGERADRARSIRSTRFSTAATGARSSRLLHDEQHDRSRSEHLLFAASGRDAGRRFRAAHPAPGRRARKGSRRSAATVGHAIFLSP